MSPETPSFEIPPAEFAKMKLISSVSLATAVETALASTAVPGV